MFRLNGESKMSQEELLMLVDEVQQDGSIDKNEGELLKNAIDFSEQQAQDILIHRVDLAALPITASKEGGRGALHGDEILPPSHLSGFHRPHSRHGPSEGFLRRLRDYGKAAAGDHRAAAFVLENEPISRLLKTLQKAKTHVAVVVDEYGGTCGIVTMEDILEELVGEIWDEHDEIEVFIRKTGANTFLVDAGMDFDEFAAYFQLKTDSEMTSVSGWVMEQFGRVPESGERITAGPLDVLVTKVDNHRIEEIQITQHAPRKRPLPPQRKTYKPPADFSSAGGSSCNTAFPSVNA